MRPATLSLVLVLIGLATADTLRVMSYNIRAGVGMDDVFNLTRQALAILAADPDVVGLQEVDNLTQRHYVDEAATLARLTGRVATFAKMRDFEGGGYGVALLTRTTPIERREYHYHNPARPGPNNCTGPPIADDYCQGAVATRIALRSGNTVWVATTHIGLYGMQLNEVSQLVDDFVPSLLALSRDEAVFVTGDFNDVPTSAAVQYVVARNMSDTWPSCGVGAGYTFDAAKPFERIDYIFQRPPQRFVCKYIVVPDTQASDHRPVVASFFF